MGAACTSTVERRSRTTDFVTVKKAARENVAIPESHREVAHSFSVAKHRQRQARRSSASRNSDNSGRTPTGSDTTHNNNNNHNNRSTSSPSTFENASDNNTSGSNVLQEAGGVLSSGSFPQPDESHHHQHSGSFQSSPTLTFMSKVRAMSFLTAAQRHKQEQQQSSSSSSHHPDLDLVGSGASGDFLPTTSGSYLDSPLAMMGSLPSPSLQQLQHRVDIGTMMKLLQEDEGATRERLIVREASHRAALTKSLFADGRAGQQQELCTSVVRMVTSAADHHHHHHVHESNNHSNNSSVNNGSSSSVQTTPAKAGRLTKREVQRLNREVGCHVIIRGQVYDVSKFIDSHPGGVQVLADLGGRDATVAFEEMHGGCGSSKGLQSGAAVEKLKSLHVGPLVYS